MNEYLRKKTMLWAKDLKKYKKKQDEKFIEENGEDCFNQNKERLDREFEYCVKQGFIREDPNLPIREGEAITTKELESKGFKKGVGDKYYPQGHELTYEERYNKAMKLYDDWLEGGRKGEWPVTFATPSPHNTCMDAQIRGYKKFWRKELKEKIAKYKRERGEPMNKKPTRKEELKEIRKDWNKELGKEFVKKYKKRLDKEWEYLLESGLIEGELRRRRLQKIKKERAELDYKKLEKLPKHLYKLSAMSYDYPELLQKIKDEGIDVDVAEQEASELGYSLNEFYEAAFKKERPKAHDLTRKKQELIRDDNPSAKEAIRRTREKDKKAAESVKEKDRIIAEEYKKGLKREKEKHLNTSPLSIKKFLQSILTKNRKKGLRPIWFWMWNAKDTIFIFMVAFLCVGIGTEKYRFPMLISFGIFLIIWCTMTNKIKKYYKTKYPHTNWGKTIYPETLMEFMGGDVFITIFMSSIVISIILSLVFGNWNFCLTPMYLSGFLLLYAFLLLFIYGLMKIFESLINKLTQKSVCLTGYIDRKASVWVPIFNIILFIVLYYISTKMVLLEL